MSINDFERSRLIAKYRMDQPPDPNNPEAKGILDSEWNDPGNWLLCDPVGSPEMYERVSEVYRSLRTTYAPDRINANPDRYPQDGVLVWKSHWNCNINIADRCDRSVEPEDFPISFGSLEMVFKCCSACKAKAVELAQMGTILGLMAAHERAALPPLP